MANKGVLKATEDSYSIELSWEVVQQSAQTLTSSVVFVATLTTDADRDSVLCIENFIAYCNVNEVIEEFTDGRTIILPGKTVKIGTGAAIVKHDLEGVGSMLLGFEWLETDPSGLTTTECWVNPKTFYLDPINLNSPVATNGGYVGEEIIINISKANTNFTHTLTYEFGNLTGSIVAKTSDSQYIWRLPDEFYAEMPNVATKTGKITCITYSGNTIVGESTCDLVVKVNPNNNLPTISASVKDINEATLALTGNENIFVHGESTAEYEIDAAASNYATIVEQSIQCGNKIVSDMPQGIIQNVESGEFIITATDSRGLTTSLTLQRDFVEYLRPTCNQNLTIEMVEGTGAKVKVKLNGNCFAGSFGAVQNTLKLEMRHTQNNGEMGEWVDLSALPVELNSNNTYELEVEVSGLENYVLSYDFQCRITDKLHYVETPIHTIKILTVFDWSRTDFNFNVPVNIQANTLDFHEETVLRHNEEANNTVLSASGGHIYMRPGGTNETDGETIIYPDGKIAFGNTATFPEGANFTGDVLINGRQVMTINEDEPPVADYIVEAGSESMGSNGTWYWEKWSSGKAVCWGSRNYGQTSLTYNENYNKYITPSYTQNFPTNLFIDDPIFSQADIRCHLDWDNQGMKVVRQAVRKDKISYFWIEVDQQRTALPATFVSFYVIGRWK